MSKKAITVVGSFISTLVVVAVAGAILRMGKSLLDLINTYKEYGFSNVPEGMVPATIGAAILGSIPLVLLFGFLWFLVYLFTKDHYFKDKES